MHYQKRNQKALQAINFIFLLMIIYGVYKNAISYILIGKEEYYEAIRLLFFPLLGVISQILTNLVQKRNLFSKIYEGLFLGLIVPPRFPIWLFLILVILYSNIKCIHLKLPISRVLFFKILLCLSSILLSISYENQIENTTPYLYGTLDLFLGRGVGNFGTTSILLLILLYIILNTDFYYKKELPIYMICGFFLPSLFYGIINPNYLFLREVLNSHLWVTAILFLPANEYSPVTKKGKIIFGFAVGVLSFLLVEIENILDGSYYALAIGQILLLFTRKIWLEKKTIVYAKKV